MRNPSPNRSSSINSSASSSSSSLSSNSPTSWRGHTNRAKTLFERGNYEEALASYRAALNPEYNCPKAEQQILLSNIVACRLKIGSRPMIQAAVEEAKQCIALNDKWAKGHIRLASAYIALGNHSNDACNSLQRALALDPRNTTARQMLMEELRRDRRPNNNVPSADNGGGGGGGGVAEPSAPPAEEIEEENDQGEREEVPPHNPSYFPNTFASSSTSNNNRDQGTGQTGPNDYMGSPTAPAYEDSTTGIDDSLSFTERIQFHLARLSAWYNTQLSDDMRTLIKVSLVLLVLYVALGGRFGLDSTLGSKRQRQNRGNYDYGNAYDRFYTRTTGGNGADNVRTGYNDRYRSYSGSGGGVGGGAYYRFSSSSSAGTGTGRRTTSSYTSSSRTYGDGDYYHYNDYEPSSSSRSRRQRTSSSSSHSFHFPNLFDGSVQSMICLAAIAFLCHKNGINPFHAIWMLNMFTGHRGRRGAGMHMHRMGMAGMGYNLFRQHQRANQNNNRWY